MKILLILLRFKKIQKQCFCLTLRAWQRCLLYFLRGVYLLLRGSLLIFQWGRHKNFENLHVFFLICSSQLCFFTFVNPQSFENCFFLFLIFNAILIRRFLSTFFLPILLTKLFSFSFNLVKNLSTKVLSLFSVYVSP